MSIEFVREDVPEIQGPPRTSLLSSALSTPGSVAAAPAAPATLTATVPATSSPSMFADLGVSEDAGLALHPGFSVHEVVRTLISKLRRGEVASAVGAEWKGASEYELRIAEDDGTSVDEDFPEVDGSALITSIGVDKFLLVDSATERPVLRLSIPSDAMELRACERTGVSDLVITCYLLAHRAATGAPRAVVEPFRIVISPAGATGAAASVGGGGGGDGGGDGEGDATGASGGAGAGGGAVTITSATLADGLRRGLEPEY